MSGALLYDFGGLVTAPGLLARNPASCVAVSNFRFPAPGIMRKRHGFALSANTAGVNEVFLSLMSLPALGANYYALGGGAGAPALYQGGGSGAWSAIADVGGSVYANAFTEGRAASLGGRNYVASRGVRRIDPTGYRAAGMPRGLPPFTYSMNPAVYNVLNGAGGFLPDGSNVAYRVTYHFKSGDTELGGAPTSRLVIRNIAGTSGYVGATTQQVRLRIPVPYELDSATTLAPSTFFWRLWRSAVSAVDTAGDEMYQVAEAFFSAADIAAGYAVFTDLTPDAFLQGSARLNTNGSNFPPLEAGLANGQTNADEPPPLCRDMCVFANCMWYVSSFTRAATTIKLLSPAFAAGNTVTINGQACTAVAGVPVNPGDFTIVGGLGSLSLNIEATARNLVDAYNRTAARATVQAHYISQGTQSPGLIFLEATNNLGSFAVQSAAAGALFQPNITTAQTITATLPTNTLRFSKPGRPDAVPSINSIDIGPSGATVYRIFPFRERLLVFSSAGLYQVDGTNLSNFTVSLVDSTARLFQRESVAASEDAVFAWCFNGIVQITDGGTRVISDVIEPLVQGIFAQITAASPGNTIYTDGFSVASKREHVVYFFYNTTAAFGNASTWLEYDTRERKWSTGATTDGTGRASGTVQESTGAVILSLGSGTPFAPSGVAKIFFERNSLLATDFQDDSALGVAAPIASSATFQLQLPDPDGRQHWQQLLLQFENGEASWLTRPTGVALSWYTDAAGIVGAASFSVSGPLLRVETPALARRATRQQVVLSHSLAENCGLLVLNQSMRRAPARFPR